MKPPRLLSWLLLHSLHPAERAYVIGDCEEEYQELAATHGHGHARRWFRGKVARSIAFNLVRRAHRRPS